MNNHQPLREDQIIALLSELKEKDVAVYPGELLEKRREKFRKAVLAGFVFGIPIWFLIKGFFGKLTWEGVVKIILVTLLAAEIAVGAYLYRDTIRNWLLPPPAPAVVLPAKISPTPQLEVTPTFTVTPTPTPTPTPIVTSATPKVHPTDSGNHYGQTKTPLP